jgi:hypothetical protein
MVEHPSIPQDDLIDVTELADKLEDSMYDILSGNQRNIAISALMSASINCMYSQCRNMEQALFYKNLFIQILQNSTAALQFKEP